jgi:hypothetical protein
MLRRTEVHAPVAWTQHLLQWQLMILQQHELITHHPTQTASIRIDGLKLAVSIFSTFLYFHLPSHSRVRRPP